MAILTPSQLVSASNATYFDNTSGSITPGSVRNLNADWISSSILVDQTSSLSVASAVSASYALTASYASNVPETASYALNALSASYALTASYASNVPETASYALNALSASYALNASNADNATTSSYALTATSASHANNADNAISSSYAVSASNAATASSADQFNVRTALTASGLRYPTVDNGAKSFIQTDGAGNLSLQYVDTIWESVRAGENVAKGTPLYISGSQGATPIVYAADASNPAKMPVTFIAGQAYTAGTTYNAIVLGLIEGLDLTGYTAGQTVYVAEGGGWTTSLPSGSNSITQVLGVVTKGGSGGKGLVLNPGPAQLPGLQAGYTWVGNGNNRPIAVTTSSIQNVVSASYANNANLLDGLDSTVFVQTGSYDTFSGSIAGRVTNLEGATGSYATLNGNNTFTGVNTFGEVTASYVKALSASIDYLSVIYQTSSVVYSSGSNQFGDAADDVQTLFGTVNVRTGPLLVTGSVNSLGGFTGSLQGNASTATSASYATSASRVISAETASYVNQLNQDVYITGSIFASGEFTARNSVTIDATAFQPGTIIIQQQSGDGLIFTTDADNIGTTFWSGSAILTTNPTNAYTTVFGFDPRASYTDGRVTVFTPLIASSSIDVIRGGITGSLLGNASTATSASYALTASYALNVPTASATASYVNPLVQDVKITGSLGVSGSVNIDNGTVQILGPGTPVGLNYVAGTDIIVEVVGQDISEYEAYANATGDAFNTHVDSNGTQLRDLNGNTLLYNTWLTVPSNVPGANPAPIMSRGLTVSGSTKLSGSITTNGSTVMQQANGFPLLVSGTLQTQRIHFNGNPFNGVTGSNLGAIRFEGNNETFYSTNYDLSNISTGSTVGQTVITASGQVSTYLQSSNYGNNYTLTLSNIYGTGSLVSTAPLLVSSSITSTGNVIVSQSVTAHDANLVRAAFNGNPFNNEPSSYLGAIRFGANNNDFYLTNYNQGLTPQAFTTQSVVGMYVETGSNYVNSYLRSVSAGVSGTLDLSNANGNIRLTTNAAFNVSASNSIYEAPGGAGVGTWFQNRVLISGPSAGETPTLWISGSDGAYTQISRGSNNINTTIATGIDASGQIYANDTKTAGQYIGVYTPDTFVDDVEHAIIVTNTGVTLNDWDNGSTFNYVPYLTIAPNLGDNPAPQMQRGLGVTGSLYGNVVSASIASNTSSLDFSQGNFFTSLVSGSTNFNITNPKRGQTVNLLLSTVGTATASFSSNVKQVSGSAYTPTSGSGKNDILTFVSWDGSTVYLANVKNLI